MTPPQPGQVRRQSPSTAALRRQHADGVAVAKAAAQEALAELAWVWRSSWQGAAAGELLGAHMHASELLERALKACQHAEAVIFDVVLDEAERPARNRAQLQAEPQPRLELVEKEAA